MKVVNELVTKNEIPAAESYSELGLEQMSVINPKIVQWVGAQSFGKDAQDPTVQSMKISGNFFKDYDRLQWGLRFAEFKLGMVRALSDALLHIKRLPNVTLHNSAPEFFSTSDYIQIAVKNGETGWMRQGTFPINTRVGKDYSIRERTDDPLVEIPDIAIHTDTLRDAKAGFKGVLEWAKFRSMALTCSRYLTDRLKEERDKQERKTPHEALRVNDFMRDRLETVSSLMLELFPDTRVRTGATALRSYYRPGFLEAELARELQIGVRLRFGWSDPSEKRIILTISGKPIEIISTHGKGAYDARMRFEVQTYSASGLEEELPLIASLDAQLSKFFNVNVESPSKIHVAFELTDAHKIVEQIKEGNSNTYLHNQARFLLEAMGEMYSLVKSWNKDKKPMLDEGFKVMEATSKESHFSRLGPTLNEIVREYEVKN